MYEYKGKGKGVKIDNVLDEFNRLTLGESRARGSNDPMPNEHESMQEKPRNKKLQRKTKTIKN